MSASYINSKTIFSAFVDLFLQPTIKPNKKNEKIEKIEN